MKTVPGIHMSNPFESENAHMTSPMMFAFGERKEEGKVCNERENAWLIK